MDTRVLEAEFLTTAVSPDGYPSPDRPEIAFVGRSNVGKSSMINALTQRKKLVRVSNTPGRTRAINFFNVTAEVEGKRHALRFADLPGYGYAKVSKMDRKAWDTLIGGYLKNGKYVKAVVAIVDAEVGPTEDDFHTLDYLTSADRRILCVATKIDRLPKAKRKPRLLEISKRLELPLETVVGFSSVEPLGRDEVWAALAAETSK